MRRPSFRRVGLVALDDEKAVSARSELVELVGEVAFAQPVPFYLSRADGLDAPAPEGLFDEGAEDAGASPVQCFLSQALHLIRGRRHAAQPQALAAFLLTLVVPARRGVSDDAFGRYQWGGLRGLRRTPVLQYDINVRVVVLHRRGARAAPFGA